MTPAAPDAATAVAPPAPDLPPGLDPETAAHGGPSDLQRIRERGRSRTTIAVLGPAFDTARP